MLTWLAAANKHNTKQANAGLLSDCSAVAGLARDNLPPHPHLAMPIRRLVTPAAVTSLPVSAAPVVDELVSLPSPIAQLATLTSLNMQLAPGYRLWILSWNGEICSCDSIASAIETRGHILTSELTRKPTQTAILVVAGREKRMDGHISWMPSSIAELTVNSSVLYGDSVTKQREGRFERYRRSVKVRQRHLSLLASLGSGQALSRS